MSWDEGMTPEELRKAWDDLPSVLESKLQGAAKDVGERVAGDARQNVSSDRGRLQNSIISIVENVGDAIIRVKVGSNVDYAEPQEKGTDPFFPPPSELRDWARRVLGAEDPDSAAFLVARSISETGIEAQEYLLDAFKENLEWALDRIVRSIHEAFSEVGLS